ncbi:MAG TPA: type IV toxin-antitoxin system AbiEi family antitoxin domain-containing protein, partial [Polyangiales bacterium]|nr:type IV toxin-antitoxin system AbiEi family antitoxin domain-containing protein [Polyangiales bacterium]
ALYRVAEPQSGFFTTEQAEQAGYSRRLLTHHVGRRRFERRARGVYRLVHFPQVTDAEDLVVHWLWSEREGVYSHATALQLHQLSDAMPERATMTLPTSWSKRRLLVPADLRLRFADLAPVDSIMARGVPATTPARTVIDCALAFVEPHLVGQAVREGLERGLFVEADVQEAIAYVREQGG